MTIVKAFTEEYLERQLALIKAPDRASPDILLVKCDEPSSLVINPSITITLIFCQLTLRKVEVDSDFIWVLMGIEMSEEKLSELFQQQTAAKLTIANNFGRLYPYLEENFKWPEVNYVKDEICKCLMLNYYQAAITLTNHLLERILKLGLIYLEVGCRTAEDMSKVGDKFRPAIERYEDMILNKTINLSCSKQIITKDRKQALHRYREIFRNGFSHADMTKILGEVQGRFVQGSFKGENTSKVFNLKFSEVPFLQGVAQRDFAEANAFYYFQIVLGTVEEVINNVDERLAS